MVPAWSPDGSQITFSHGYRIFVASSNGTRLHSLSDKAPPDDPNNIDFSPNISRVSGRLAFATLKYPTLGRLEAWAVHGEGRRNTFDIAVADLDGSDEERLTIGGPISNEKAIVGQEMVSIAPVWSPDGTRIAYLASRWPYSGRYGVYVMKPDGTGVTEISHYFDRRRPPYLVTVLGRPAWSPDSKALVYLVQEFTEENETRAAVHVAHLDSGEWSRTRESVGLPSWSPNGEHVAYITKEDSEFVLIRMNRAGEELTEMASWEEELLTPRDLRTNPIGLSWSPDGSRVLVGSNPLKTVKTDGPRTAVYSRDTANVLTTMDADGRNQRVVVWNIATTVSGKSNLVAASKR